MVEIKIKLRCTCPKLYNTLIDVDDRNVKDHKYRKIIVNWLHFEDFCCIVISSIELIYALGISRVR